MYLLIMKLTIRNNFKGFTLIELLVVIAILGILAAALLAAINPIEQIRKSQDSSSQRLSTEFNSAVGRYYTTHNRLPWDTTAVNPTTGANGSCNTAVSASSATPLSSLMANCVAWLIAEGE